MKHFTSGRVLHMRILGADDLVLNIIAIYGVSAPLQAAPKRKINADVHHTVKALCKETQHECTIVMGDLNTVTRDQDQSKGKMEDYDTNAFAIGSLLESLRFSDCGRMGQHEPAFSFIQQGVPVSQIDAIYVNSTLHPKSDADHGIQHATATQIEPLSGDHRAVVANISSCLRFSTPQGNTVHQAESHIVPMMSVNPKRPRRCKLNKTTAAKFRDALSHEGAYDKPAQVFLNCQPDDWCRTANAITLLGLPNLILTRKQITTAVMRLTDHNTHSNTVLTETSLVKSRIDEAAYWLLVILGHADSIDLSPRRTEIHLAADFFFRESSSCIRKACGQATALAGHKDNHQTRPVIQRGKILRVLQLWHKVERCRGQDWLGFEVCEIRRGICASAKKAELGINTRTPQPQDPEQEWRQWAHGSGDTSGTITFLTAWAASENILVVHDTILCPQYNTNDSCTLSETRKRDLDTALLSGKTKGGKIDGLYIALDADGVEIPETDKGNLEQHILSIVKYHGSEKGVGKLAYAATAVFHECMFSTTNDWRGNPQVACQSGLMVASAVQRYTERLTLLTPLLLHVQEQDDNPPGTWNSTFLHNCMTLRPIASDDLHFHEPPKVTHAFNALQHPSTSLCVTMGIFRQALGKDHDPNRQLIALKVLSKHLETSGTGPPGLTQAIRLPNKSWTLLHDTVVEVMESWKSQIRTESNLIQQMLNTHAVNMAASFSTAPLPCQL